MSNVISLRSKASITNNTDIIFVTLAGLNCSCEFFSNNTFPENCSIRIADVDSKFKKLSSVEDTGISDCKSEELANIVDHIYS